MSYTVETATMIHDRQVAAARTVQSLMVEAAKSMTELTDKAPKAPEKLSSKVRGVVSPLTKVVGTPSEVQAYAAASSREWLEVQHKFQTALLDAMSAATPTVDAPRRASKKN